MSIVKGAARDFSMFAHFCERQIPISYIFHSACRHLQNTHRHAEIYSFCIVFLDIVYIQIERSDV